MKRQNKYRAEFANQFVGIKAGKNEFHALCIPCNFQIDLTSMGKAAIQNHQSSGKHIANAEASASSGVVDDECRIEEASQKC